MRRIIIALGVVALVSASVTGVTAQQATTTAPNETTTNTTTVQNQIRAQLGNDLTLVDVTAEEGKLILTLDADAAGTVLWSRDNVRAMTAGGETGDGVQVTNLEEFERRHNLEFGRQKLVLDLDRYQGYASATVWTSEKAFVIRKDLPKDSPVPGEPGFSDVLVTGGISAMLFTFSGIGAIWWHRKQEGGVRDIF